MAASGSGGGGVLAGEQDMTLFDLISGFLMGLGDFLGRLVAAIMALFGGPGP